MTDAPVDPFASATTLLEALRGGHISSAELTELYIGRIERQHAAVSPHRPRLAGRRQ